MSVVDVAARVAQLEALMERRAAPAGLSVAPATASPSFEATLAAAGAWSSGAGLAAGAARPVPFVFGEELAALGADSAGGRVLAAAQAEVGQAEFPPGSNDGPRIADYRSAVPGAYAGAPWCAYFVSWAAAQAGVPLGESGSGFGAVEQVADWAARTGRLVPAGGEPQPGDLILFGGRHIGIVESVNADGTLTTVEGNSSNAVSRVVRSRGDATGYVRL